MQAFRAVPLDVRLTFHTALMRMNGPVIQTVMALAFLGSVALAVINRGGRRWTAAAATAPPPDHASILRRWEIFNVVRTVAAVAAFGLLLLPSRR